MFCYNKNEHIERRINMTYKNFKTEAISGALRSKESMEKTLT